MSIRRTQQTVENLWRAMEQQLPPPQAQFVVPRATHPNPNHSQRARASPPPDPELGHRGHYYQHAPPPQLTAEAMQPPRLQQSGCCSRMLILSMCCFLLFGLLLACTAFLNLPVVKEHLMPAPPVKQRPLPAILHRYGMIKRAPAPGRGADPVALAAAFPHWRGPDGALAFDAVVSDVALGLAAIVERLDPSQEARVLSVAPHTPSPPSPGLANPPPEGDPDPEEL